MGIAKRPGYTSPYGKEERAPSEEVKPLTENDERNERNLVPMIKASLPGK